MEWLKASWPWYVSGPLITLVMFTLLYFGKTFGVSSNLRVICAACGAGKSASFFNFKWKNQLWNMLFVGGALLGGWIAQHFMPMEGAVEISEKTVKDLEQLGVAAKDGYLPKKLFSWENLFTAKGLIMLIGGGFLVGFGTRYAGGCTSGHAITGLSNLQLPSLIAVVGFFIGGLLMTHLLMPFILKL